MSSRDPWRTRTPGRRATASPPSSPRPSWSGHSWASALWWAPEPGSVNNRHRVRVSWTVLQWSYNLSVCVLLGLRLGELTGNELLVSSLESVLQASAKNSIQKLNNWKTGATKILLKGGGLGQAFHSVLHTSYSRPHHLQFFGIACSLLFEPHDERDISHSGLEIPIIQTAIF